MKKILYMIGAIGLMVSSCTKGDNFDTSNDSVLRITSGIATRAVGNMWQQNDAIGVTMFETSTTTAIGKANTQYAATQSGGGAATTFATADFAVAAGETDLYYPSSGNVDIVAYYPYLQSGDGKSYVLDMATTQTDLMVAAKRNQAKSNSSLAMKFHHVLSQITVAMTAGDGLIADDIAEGNVTVKLLGTDTKATYNLTAFDPNAPYATTPIEGLETMSEITLPTSGLTAMGFAIPQVLSSGAALIFEVSGYGTFAMPITTAAFQSGSSHDYTVTISRTGVTLTGNNITAWVDDTEDSDNNGTADEIAFANEPDLGMYYYKDGRYSKWSQLATNENPIIGIIFFVGIDGKSGMVVSLEEHSTHWSAAKTWAENYNGGGKDWHSPLHVDLRKLYAGMSGLHWKIRGNNPSGLITGNEIVDWGVFSTMTSYDDQVYVAKRAEFNDALMSVGGTELSLSNNDWYWTSTDHADYDHAWAVHFNDGLVNPRREINEYKVRAILDFGPPLPPTGDYKIGSIYPKEGEPIGVVFAINDDTDGDGYGNSGKVLSLETRSWRMWSTSKVYSVTGANDMNNGRVNTRIIVAKGNEANNYLMDAYPVFWSVNVSADFNGDGWVGLTASAYTDDVKDIWYVPAVNELVAACSQAEVINATIEREGLSSSYELLDGGNYFSSTEIDKEHAYAVQSSTAFTRENEKNSSPTMRAILEF